MEINQYLIISPGARSYKPKIKLVASLSGTMPSNSVALKLNIHLPDSLFKKPQLQATIKIKDSDVSKPVINAEVLDNIKEAVSTQLGVDLTINVVEPEK